MVFLSLSGYGQRRKPRSVPLSIPELLGNSTMLENMIKDIYGYTADQIEAIYVQEVVGGDIKGNLSDSARMKVSVELMDGQVEEFRWFVKVRPQNDNQALASQFNIFRNEIEFYTKILPELKEFLLKEGFDADFASFDVPSILYAKEEGEDAAIIILDDILAQGYRHERDQHGDKFLNVEQALTAVRSIAKLHAVTVAIQEGKQVDLQQEHPTLAQSGLLWAQEEMTDRLSLMMNSYCELLKQSSELDSPTLLSRFKQSFDSEERLVEMCRKRCKSGKNKMLSLQHGDFHFNNLMYKRDQNGRYKVMIVDWQLTYAGKTTGDLSYLLMSSLSHENRQLHEESIKKEYYAVYRATLDKLAAMRHSKAILDSRNLDAEYVDSLPLSFVLSCGNIMQADAQDQVQYSYNMCKEAYQKEII